MKRTLEYDAPGEDSLIIDFDNVSDASYRLEMRPEDAAQGDGIILTLNPRACLAFARLFAQLAEQVAVRPPPRY